MTGPLKNVIEEIRKRQEEAKRAAQEKADEKLAEQEAAEPKEPTP